VEVTGNFHTLTLVAEDRKGSIARITGILAEHDINIATLKLTRKQKGGDAFMVIECDEPPGEKVKNEIRALDWVRWARRLERVSGG
jgi:L-serine dehydratase